MNNQNAKGKAHELDIPINVKKRKEDVLRTSYKREIE